MQAGSLRMVFGRASLRLDHPLLVAQCLRENAFPDDNEKILAAVVAVFAYDRDDEITLTVKDLPPKLTRLKKVVLAVRPLAHRLEAAGFATAKLHPSAGVAMYYWAQGRAGSLSSRSLALPKAIWHHWFCAQRIICGK